MPCSEDESPQPGTEVPLAPARYLHCYPLFLTRGPPGLPSPAAFRLPCRSWRWPRPRQAACWWSCPSCGCCRCAARWPCAPCRPTASRPTPFQLPSPRPWWQPAHQPRSPAPHHDPAPRPDLPLLQPPQGLETPALPSGALTPVEHESPPEAPLPERHQKDPTRSPRHLVLRYSTAGEGDRRRLGEGLGLGPFLTACHSRTRLGQLCRVRQRTGGPVSHPRPRELPTRQLRHWPRKRLSQRPAPPREPWAGKCPVLRAAAEETQGLG